MGVSFFILHFQTILIFSDVIENVLKNSDTTIKADLRKKSSIIGVKIEYSNYDIQACMVILVIMIVLLFYQ